MDAEVNGSEGVVDYRLGVGQRYDGTVIHALGETPRLSALEPEPVG